jgi:Protein of unknown function (DUF3592)
MSFGRAFRLVAIILGAITLVLGVVCGVVAFRTRAFLADSTTASGQVIGLVSRQSCDHTDDREQDCTTAYAPRVRFTTADGRQVVFVSPNGSSPPSYEAGDRVDVRYRANDPAGARIDSLTSVWLATMVTGGLTLVFAGLCAVWVVLAVRFRKE